MHLFKKCFYILTSTRKPEWIENSTIREEIRQKIKKNPRYLIVIRQIIDINILNELNQKDQKDDETDDDHFHFSDVITISQKVIIMIIKNSLSNSVIYDFGCSQSLTYDKARFVEEITFASDWIDISNESMLAESYETMWVNDKLDDKLEDNKVIRMNFAKTTWVFTTNMTLVSVNKLKKESYIWDMNQNVLIQQKDDKKICNIEEHYELLIIEFNSMSIKKTNVVFIQKEDDSVIKTSHTDQIVTSRNEDDVSMQTNFEKYDLVSVNFEDKISSRVSVNSVNSNSDWLKDDPDDLEWMNQIAHLMNTANELKKRRFRWKKRCKKRRFKNLKNPKKLEKLGTVRRKSWFSALTRKWLARLSSFFKAGGVCHVMTWHHLMMIRRYDTELDSIEDNLTHR